MMFWFSSDVCAFSVSNSIIAALSAQLNKIEKHNCFVAGMMQVYEKPLTAEKARDLLRFIGIPS